MVSSKRAPAKGYLPGLLMPVPLSLWQAAADSCLHRRPPTLAGRSGSVSSRITARFPWVLVCTRPGYVCALQEWSLYFRQSCNQIQLTFKVIFPGDFSPFDGSSGCEAWCGAQNLHNSGRTSLVLLFSNLWVIYPVGVGLGFIMIAASPASLNMGVSFFLGGFQHPPVNGCSTASCNSGAFSRGDEHTFFCSTILNQSCQLNLSAINAFN